MEPIESPCVRNCCLNEEDICLGCFRSLAEITRWSTATNPVKQAIVQSAEMRKKEYQQKMRQIWHKG